jgi:hypothetical protein
MECCQQKPLYLSNLSPRLAAALRQRSNLHVKILARTYDRLAYETGANRIFAKQNISLGLGFNYITKRRIATSKRKQKGNRVSLNYACIRTCVLFIGTGSWRYRNLIDGDAQCLGNIEQQLIEERDTALAAAAAAIAIRPAGTCRL